MHYGELGYKTQLLGIEEQSGGASCYKIEVTRPSGEKSTDYYDLNSGLKVKTETKDNTVELGDYRDAGGVLFPFAISQSMQGQTMKFVVSNISVNSKLKKDLFEIK
jgi:hypothetical protein